MNNGQWKPTAFPEIALSSAVILCETCGADLAICGHVPYPDHSMDYIPHDVVAWLFRPLETSDGQSNFQFEEPNACTPVVEPHTPAMTMHSEANPHHTSNQPCDKYESDLLGPRAATEAVVNQVGSPAMTFASSRRRKREAKYQCTFKDCDHTFTAKHNLDSHMRAHLNFRPYGCHCGSAFAAKGDLKRHWKSQKHAGETSPNQMKSGY